MFTRQQLIKGDTMAWTCDTVWTDLSITAHTQNPLDQLSAALAIFKKISIWNMQMRWGNISNWDPCMKLPQGVHFQISVYGSCLIWAKVEKSKMNAILGKIAYEIFMLIEKNKKQTELLIWN